MSSAAKPARRRALALTVPFGLAATLNLAGLSLSDGWRHRYDLAIYLEAARSFQAGGSLYGFSTPRGLGFTYPPIAVIPFLPASSLRLDVVWAVWVVGVFVVISLCALSWARAVAPRASYLSLAFAGCALALTDPVSDSMWLGQLSPFIGAAAVGAVVGARPVAGALAGVGAALKLTPIATVAAFWLLPDRRRRIGWAVGAFVVVDVAGFLVAPGDSTAYWTTTVWDTGRVGGVASASNTSLAGLLAHAGLADRFAVIGGAAVVAAVALAWWRSAVRPRADGVDRLDPAVGRDRLDLAVGDRFDLAVGDRLDLSVGDRFDLSVGDRLDLAVGDRFDLAVAVGALTLLAVPVSWSHHALPVCLGWALLALRRRWVPAVLGTVIWTLPLFQWAAERSGAGWLDDAAQLALQSVRPLSVLWLLWLVRPRR